MINIHNEICPHCGIYGPFVPPPEFGWHLKVGVVIGAVFATVLATLFAFLQLKENEPVSCGIWGGAALGAPLGILLSISIYVYRKSSAFRLTANISGRVLNLAVRLFASLMASIIATIACGFILNKGFDIKANIIGLFIVGLILFIYFFSKSKDWQN